MPGMGPLFRGIFVVSLVLPPAVAGAQASPPAAAFPTATAPANTPPAPPSASASAPSASAPAPPAPAPDPAAAVPGTPGLAPPPVAYPAPYPYPYPYPPPPPGYAYGYYYPPPPAPLPPPRFPADAAVRSTPFFDAIVVAADWQHRISESVSLGVQAGVYVAGRVRLTAKISFPSERLGDQQADFGSGTKVPSFFYAFSAGFAAVRTPNFAMSPGLMLARTDVGDYGTMLGFSLPFDWVTSSGLRLGLEGGVGNAFGGRTPGCSTVGASDCHEQARYQDRDPGLALWLQFQIGFGFNHPGPLPPGSSTPAPSAPPLPPSATSPR